MYVYACMYVCVRVYGVLGWVYVCVSVRTTLISRHQINISAISTIPSSNQLTQHHNHIMLNSTHSSLSACPSEHQCIRIISNSETTPAGTKHLPVARHSNEDVSTVCMPVRNVWIPDLTPSKRCCPGELKWAAGWWMIWTGITSPVTVACKTPICATSNDQVPRDTAGTMINPMLLSACRYGYR